MMRREGRSVTEIAQAIGRDKSTVSRELSRNSFNAGRGTCYRASAAQGRYERRRKACRRPRILDDPAVFELVRSKFLEDQWSPEQIEGRLALELGESPVSDTTIYRGIRDGRFDGCIGGRKAACRLRHKGKRRRSPGSERRGKIRISHDIGERPAEAGSRSRTGDWESDTVAGVRDGACLVTNVDRKTGYLVGGKAARKASGEVNSVMVSSLSGMPLHSITPDRGKEFAAHAEVTEALGVEFYFALPHHPWQRGTNENTNGLLREYFPKGRPLEPIPESAVQEVYDKINRRPRKRLGFRTPYEAFFSTALQLI
jgi:IS30 family transposase